MSFARTLAATAALTATIAISTIAARAADIVDTAARAGQFNTLVTAVKAAGLVGTLKGKGPFTVFAPTDAAFAKLPKETLASLLRPENKGQLASILTYHVVSGRYPAARITGTGQRRFGLRSVQGSRIAVDLRRGVRVSGATVTRTDINTSNGVIHVIDRVIMPPQRRTSAARSRHH